MEEKIRSTLNGIVVKNNSAKTITVSFKRLVKYPKYGKYIHRVSTYKVHDEKNQAKVGDEVEIMESRPFSKTKRWCLIKVAKKAETSESAT
ncbi:MAG: 30S ribosomal protein S17 [Planctomycetota bacterium]